MKRFLSLLALLAAPAAAQFISHPPGTALADLGTCSSAREGLLRKVNNGDAASDCDPTGTGDFTVLCQCTETATDTYEWQAIPTIDESGNLVLDGQLTTGETTAPAVNFRDSDSTLSPADVNARLHVNLTDVGNGTEDADIWLAGQRAGAEVNHVTVDADGGITIGNAGNASLTVTTDSTGDGEVVLPDDSIGAAELATAAVDANALAATAIQAGDYPAAGIDGDDVNSNIAGDHLTLTGDTPDTLDVDVELKTRIESIAVENPVTGHAGLVQMMFPTAITITRLNCSTDTGTVDIQLDERAAATPNTPGTNIMAAALQCDNNEAAQTSFSNAGIASRVPLNLDIDAVASSPIQVRIFVEYTIDD